MTHLLVLRFSALGDVLMTVPVIDSFARQYPDARITVCSRAWAKSLFALLPPNVKFVAANFRDEHKGFKGLNLLGRRLLALQPTHIADLHDVLRTKWLRMRFAIAGRRVQTIHKDRRARRRFIAAEVKTPQRSVFEKYADVFRRLGFKDFRVDFRSLFPGGAAARDFIPGFDVSLRPEPLWVAVAPFATYVGKIYPLDLMEQVVAHLASRGDVRVFLFGAGKDERETLEAWAARHPQHVESVAGRLNGLAEEAALISYCRVMLAMDSANMHLASLVHVPVVSIWGATHPYGGFLGYGQRMEDAIQRTDLTCRPCSVYGNRPCHQGDYPCLNGISPKWVLERVEEKLKQPAK